MDAENTIYRTCQQRRNIRENGNKKNTHIYHQEGTAEKTRVSNKERWLGNFYTHGTDIRQARRNNKKTT